MMYKTIPYVTNEFLNELTSAIYSFYTRNRIVCYECGDFKTENECHPPCCNELRICYECADINNQREWEYTQLIINEADKAAEKTYLAYKTELYYEI